MQRRDFLTILAGSPFVFGLRELLAQDPGKPADAKAIPEWYKAALKRMKETNRYGIAIIVPDDAKERERWGKALIERYNEFHLDAHEPFGVVVLICLTRALAQRVFDFPPALVPDQVLLSPGGDPMKAVDFRADALVRTLEKPEEFSLNFKQLAYGINGEQLEAQAKAIEKKLPESLRKAAVELSGEKYAPEAAMALLEKADAILPWIIYQCREAESKLADAKPPVRVALRTMLTQYWSRQSLMEADPCLPFGLKVEALPDEDPCPACGRMAAPPGKARKFLSFYEK